MRKTTFKIFQPVIVLIIMFVTLNSFQVEERWEDIFLRGTWEEIDRSGIREQCPVTVSYGNNQVMVNNLSIHSDMTIRLLADGDLVSETEMPASCSSIIVQVPESGRNYEIEITSEFGGFLNGSFVANQNVLAD